MEIIRDEISGMPVGAQTEVELGVLGPSAAEPVKLDRDPGRNYGGLPGVKVELPTPEQLAASTGDPDQLEETSPVSL